MSSAEGAAVVENHGSLHGGREKPEEAVERIVTPVQLVSEGFHLIRTSRKSVAVFRETGVQVAVINLLDGRKAGLSTIKGLTRTFRNVAGVPDMYVSLAAASGAKMGLVEGQFNTISKEDALSLLARKQEEARKAHENKKDSADSWRNRSRRLVGALASATILLGLTFMASISPSGGNKVASPQPTASGANSSGEKDKASFLFSNPTELPNLKLYPANGSNKPGGGSASRAPDLQQPKKPEPEKPAIQPDLKAPTLWAMFEHTVGAANATGEIIRLGNVLEAKGYQVIYHGNPHREDRWWVVTIIGPDGKRYATNSQVAKLLASAS